MDPSAIETIASGLWRDSGIESTPPAPIERAVQVALPLWVVKWPSPDVPGVRACLASQGLMDAPLSEDELHGCLFAYHGRGIVFVSGQDPPSEQRFTVAHEAAHFLLDYQRPRRAVVEALGEAALDVLDGRRLPTERERMHAVLARVRVGPHLHLMPRRRTANDAGRIGPSRIDRAEEEADQLAMELVAPLRWVADALGQIAPDVSDEQACVRVAEGLGLPAQAVRGRVMRLRPSRRSPTLLNHLTEALRPTSR